MDQALPPQSLPSDADFVMVLHNPRAGRRSSQRRLESLLKAIETYGYRVEVSTDLAQATDAANRRYERGDLRCLIGIGGDGTALELINRCSPTVPLLLFPAGTSNLAASHLGISKSPEAAARLVHDGRVLRLDAGSANGRLFLVMASCGFDAAAVEMVHRRRMEGYRGGHGSFLSFVGPIVQLMRTYTFPELSVRYSLDDQTEEELLGPVAWAFVFNLPKYGWGLPLTPKADGTDGQLDICTFARGGVARGLWYTAVSQLAIHSTLPDCRLARARRVRITSSERVAYQLDGDPGGVLPLEIGVEAGRVPVVVSARTAAKWTSHSADSECR
ncbi:MAG: diacylglycerol kinase family protein [Thermogutta sp.]